MEKIMAFIHSLQSLGEATILEHIKDDEVLALVHHSNIKCRGIYNPQTEKYYLDDVYDTVDD